MPSTDIILAPCFICNPVCVYLVLYPCITLYVHTTVKAQQFDHRDPSHCSAFSNPTPVPNPWQPPTCSSSLTCYNFKNITYRECMVCNIIGSTSLTQHNAPEIYSSFCKEIQPVHSEGDQPWDFFGSNDAKAETTVLWPPHAKSWLTGKDSWRDWEQEEKGTTEDEMAGWHHQLDGHEFEWTLGVGYEQGGLACCDSWGGKELDMTGLLNWTELQISIVCSLFLSSSILWYEFTTQVASWVKILKLSGKECHDHLVMSVTEMEVESGGERVKLTGLRCQCW